MNSLKRRVLLSARQLSLLALLFLMNPSSSLLGAPRATGGESLWESYDRKREMKWGSTPDDRRVEQLLGELSSGRITTRMLDAALALGQLKALSAVAPLIDLLTASPLETVRFVAATALGEIGDPSAVSPLMVVLEDDETTPSLKTAAATALGRIGDDRAIEPLLTNLAHEDPDLRKAAASALGMIRNHRAAIPLIAAMGDENPLVRRNAAMALGEIGEPLALDALVWTLMADRDPDVRWWAAHALGAIGDTRAVEPLARFVMLKDRNGRDMSHDVFPDTEHPLAYLQKSAQWGIQVEAIHSLGRMGATALPHLRLTLLEHEDFEFRKEAAKMIMNIRGVGYTLDLLESGERLKLARDVYEHAISRGESGTESLLIEVLQEYGKIHIALDFLGSGNQTLAEAAKGWMRKNGFREPAEIPEGGPHWGDWRGAASMSKREVQLPSF